MHVALVGADYEENLGLGGIAAAALQAGHQVEVLAFNEAQQRAQLVTKILQLAPQVVGLGLQFQHRAADFLALAGALRAGGYGGHLTCGGQVATLACEALLAQAPALDSVVLHEGERSFVELLAALAAGRPLDDVPGLALRDAAGAPLRTAERALPAELDQHPFPWRYRPHSQHLGIPFIPIMGSRGCWGTCTFCSISAFYKDARARGGGRLLRLRSPENIAAEMALLWHKAGGKAVFCFHDDNFLLPRPADTLSRLQALRAALDRFGVGRLALVGKCRPETLTPELARELRALGLIRLYVGVENVSAAGAAHLNRSRQTAAVRQALAACDEAGIFGCYNLLVFEPETRLEDVAENLAFIREVAHHPVNFCRAEPYSGTALQRSLAQAGNLGGSLLGYDYRLTDDRAELLFRICAAAFRQRNFATNGVHNRYMGLGYLIKLIEQFFDDELETARASCEVEALTREITRETADFLEEALQLARQADLADGERVTRETALLGLRIAAADRQRQQQLDALFARLEQLAAGASPLPETLCPLPPSRLGALTRQVAQGMTIASLVAALGAGAAGCDDDRPVPSDAGPQDGTPELTVVDMLPPDAGQEGMVLDPLPADGGPDYWIVDPLPVDGGPDYWIVDPLPVDGGQDSLSGDPIPPDAGTDVWIVDPLPGDAGISALEPGLAGDDQTPRPPRAPAAGDQLAQWRDTAPRRTVRSKDLPLFDPPVVCLAAAPAAEGVRVVLQGGPQAVSIRWEGDGEICGEGREVLWQPGSPEDQLRAGVRSAGGIAVVALRAKDVG